MTNNNWIEEFDEKFDWLTSNQVSFMVLGEVRKLNTDLTRQEFLDFISNLLTKKDQEHKAELEMIKIEVFEKSDDLLWGNGKPAVIKTIDAIDILDKHINK